VADQEELLKAILQKRDMATRVRRLALGLFQTDDRLRLMRYAEEIDEDVRLLELQLA